MVRKGVGGPFWDPLYYFVYSIYFILSIINNKQLKNKKLTAYLPSAFFSSSSISIFLIAAPAVIIKVVKSFTVKL